MWLPQRGGDAFRSSSMETLKKPFGKAAANAEATRTFSRT
jgi:hypothetical protein